MGLDYTNKDGAYRIRDLVMRPHPHERILADLYYRFEAQGLLEILFHEGAKPTLVWFLSTFLAPETSTLACYRETSDGEYAVDDKRYTPLGITCINKTWPIGENFRKAECGMGFVRRVPLDDTVDCAKMTLEWAFNHLALDALIGTTPAPNRAATIFGQKVGFQQAGVLEGYTCWHGKLCGVVLQSMTRDRWMKIRAQESEVA
jgi:hypothetical protein